MSAVRYVADYTFHFRPAETRRVLVLPQRRHRDLADDPRKPPDRPSRIAAASQSRGRRQRRRSCCRSTRSARASGIVGRPEPLARGLGRAGAAGAAPGDPARRCRRYRGDRRRQGARRRCATRSRRWPAATAATTRSSRSPRCAALRQAERGRCDGCAATAAAASSIRAATAFTANPGESDSDLLRRAVRRGRARYRARPEEGGRRRGLRSAGQRTLTAVLPIAGLDDWVRARERLPAVPAIRKVALVALSRQEATIEIGYAGSIDQLKSELARISLDLVRATRAGGSPAPAPARTLARRAGPVAVPWCPRPPPPRNSRRRARSLRGRRCGCSSST